MSKKRIDQIAKEYGVPTNRIRDIVFNDLSEEMVKGTRGIVWVNDDGQRIIDERISIPMICRGKVTGSCPNKKFVYVNDMNLFKKVAVKIPNRLIGKLIGKVIYYEQNDLNGQLQYNYIKTPVREKILEHE